jgi:hypothetical protein
MVSHSGLATPTPVLRSAARVIYIRVTSLSFSFRRIASQPAGRWTMATFHAQMIDAETGGEGNYRFEAAADLMNQTGDEIVTVFFNQVESELLRGHADWELNGVMNNRDRRVVTAMGSLIPEKNDPPLPFLLMISERNPRE